MTRIAYPSDVIDDEWAFVAPYLTLMTEEAPQRDHSLREVFNGLRWTKDAVENLLRLRVVAENDDWTTFQRLNQQKRNQRLYGVPLRVPDTGGTQEGFRASG